MKGTEVTQVQLDHASTFLEITGCKKEMTQFTTTREQLVRIVAWYGAIRAGERKNDLKPIGIVSPPQSTDPASTPAEPTEARRFGNEPGESRGEA